MSCLCSLPPSLLGAPIHPAAGLALSPLRAASCSALLPPAGAGRMGDATQYTVNNQMVNATLMNIADSPTNVQLPGERYCPALPVLGAVLRCLPAAPGQLCCLLRAPTRSVCCTLLAILKGCSNVQMEGRQEQQRLAGAPPSRHNAQCWASQLIGWLAECVRCRCVQERGDPPRAHHLHG